MPLLFLLYLVIPGLQVWFFLDPATSHVTGDFWPPATELANYIVSVLVFHALLANVIVSVRLPWVQKWLPHDLKIRFHIVATAFIAGGVAYHALFKILDGKDIDGVAWTLMVLFAVFVILGLLWTPVPGFQRFRKKLHTAFHRMGFLTYGFYKRLHNTLMLALAAVLFIHVVMADAVFQDNPVSTFLWFAYPVSAVLLFLWSKIRILFLPEIRLLSLARRGEILTLEFNPHPRLRYKPGQYAYLRFHGQQGSESHPFSFLSVPQDEKLTFGIRALGDFTRSLGRFSPGAPVRIDGAYGAFHPAERDHKLCFVASGIGVVPFLSLLKYLDHWDDHRPVLFFISVSRVEEIPDYPWLVDLARRSSHLKLVILEQSLKKQRFDLGLFDRNLESPQSWTYWVCTSPAVWKGTRQALRSLGVPGKRIHSERFSFGSY